MTTVPYWLLFSMPLIGLAFQPKISRQAEQTYWTLTCCLFILGIGLRHHVGGDWAFYDRFVEAAKPLSLGDALSISDPAYSLFNWLGAQAWGSVHFANFACAILAIVPLFVFCRTRSNPWLSLSVAVPYLLIVVYMGYTRQSAAIGLCITAIMLMEKDRLWGALATVMLAGLFHRTAAGFVAPIIVCAALPLQWDRSGRLLALSFVSIVYLWVIMVGIGGPGVGGKLSGYTSMQGELHSLGALPRLGLSVLAGLGFFWIARRESFSQSNIIWTLCALGSLALLPLAFFTSTLADRVGLYLIPLQLHVASLIDAKLEGRPSQFWYRLALVTGLASMLLIWLFRSSYARYWLPYDNVLFHVF